MLNKKKNNKGFTLVELLVVIAIIGILAVVAVPALFRNIEKSKVASLESDVNAIRAAGIAYYGDTGLIPEATDADAIVTLFDGELDAISDPFKTEGNYALTEVSADGAATVSQLVITLPGTTKFSEKAQTKLTEDLKSLNAQVDDTTLTVDVITVK